MSFSEAVQDLANKGVFSGGPNHLFESAGRLQFATLIREGLWPDSKLLDIGCGALRAGYWLVRFLDANCYYGIEPAKEMLELGINHFLTPELMRQKCPHFDTNDRFDFSVFQNKFDVFLARSIWSHASKPQIRTMLKSFVETANPRAFFLTSYLPAKWYRRYQRDYQGSDWVGRSHNRVQPGEIRHSFRWIKSECETLNLTVHPLSDRPFNGQFWLRIDPAKRADSRDSNA